MAAGLSRPCAPAGCRLARMCAALVLAMSTAVSEAQPVLEYASGFQREVSRFRWTSSSSASIQVARWQLSLDNRFLSDAFLRFDDRLQFRDENVLSVDAEHPLVGRTAVGLRAYTAWFGLSRAFAQDVLGSVRLRPGTGMLVEPFLGVAWDRRPGPAEAKLDYGPAFGGRWSMDRHDPDGYRIRLAGEGTWRMIRPRHGRRAALSGSAGRQFGSTRLHTALRASSLRRDAYRAASFLNRTAGTGLSPEAVEATTSDTLNVSVQLEAPFLWGIRVLGQADLAVNARRIRTHHAPENALFFETDFSRRALDAEIGLVYEEKNVSARLYAEAGAAAEVRRLANRDGLPVLEAAQKTALLAQADYDEGALGLSTALRAVLTRRLTAAMAATSRIVRHDTPEINQDDRDEVYHNAELGLQVALSRYVSIDLTVFGSYYHAVYLRAERSAENNVQRTIRMRPSIDWRPSGDTEIRLASEVRATYTVDDFLLPGRRPTDQSARELRFEATVNRRIAGDVRVLASGSYGDLRLGRLLWDSFAEIPFDTLRTYRAWLHLQAGSRIVADVGWRLFIRSDYDRAATISYIREDGRTGTVSRPGRRSIDQSGPTTSLSWMMGRSHLQVEGWVNMQRIRYRLFGELPEQRADAIREAARRGSRRLIPNIMLSASWKL